MTGTIGAKRTILYIEDDPSSRTLVERTLKFAGYTVLVADCGLVGIDLARKFKPDLILTDINLPDLSGREITTTLRRDEDFRNTPIVALTAQGYGEQRDMALAAGVNGYLTKPIDVEELPKQIAHYLGGANETLEADRMIEAQTKYAQEVVSRLEQRIRKLEAANHELRKLDKMKDAFIQVTAHELRTPLTLVYGYARLMEDNQHMKAALAADVGLGVLEKGLVDGIERMQKVINEIVTISRIMTQEIDLALGFVNAGTVIRRVIEDYGDALQTRRVTLHVTPDGWPATMRADADMLHLTFSNLVGNAIKYTPDGGHVYISAKVDTLNRLVRFNVRDTGIGIDPIDQATIFERFHVSGDTKLHSTSKVAFRGGGLGLGLAICKGIVGAHGGKIWVESPGYDAEKCPGSEFIVELPLGIAETVNGARQPLGAAASVSTQLSALHTPPNTSHNVVHGASSTPK